MTNHSIRVWFDTDMICAEAVCSAAPDADCRLSCDEGCEEWGAITRDADGIWHDADARGTFVSQRHRMHVVDYCNVCEFLNDDGAAEFGSGVFDIATFAIESQWQGDHYMWTPIASQQIDPLTVAQVSEEVAGTPYIQVTKR